jgi:hypothetical protein
MCARLPVVHIGEVDQRHVRVPVSSSEEVDHILRHEGELGVGHHPPSYLSLWLVGCLETTDVEASGHHKLRG